MTASPLHRRQWILGVLVVLFIGSIGTFIGMTFQDVSRAALRVSQDANAGQWQKQLLESTDVSGHIPFVTVQKNAQAAYRSADFARAEELYTEALSRASALPAGSDIPIIRRLFDLKLLRGDIAGAEDMLGLLTFRGVGQETISALRGLILLREGDIASAGDLFGSYPNQPDHAFGRMLVSILTGNHEQAQASLSTVRSSHDPLLTRAADTVQGAYDEFALFQDGLPIHLQTLLARALSEIGQYPVALQLLDQVVTQDPEYRDAWIVSGYSALMIGDHAQALASFEQAYKLDPEKAETQYFLGLTHERLGDLERAMTFLVFALENGFEPSAEIRQHIAVLAETRGDYELAAEHYVALLNEENDFVDPAERLRIASALITLLVDHLGDEQRAHQTALVLRKEQGDVPAVLDLVGWTYLITGDTENAEAFLSAALSQDPSLASGWYHQGLLLEEKGQKQEALGAYQKAYSLSLGSDEGVSVRAAERYNEVVAGL